jgi:hypothetical protein
MRDGNNKSMKSAFLMQSTTFQISRGLKQTLHVVIETGADLPNSNSEVIGTDIPVVTLLIKKIRKQYVTLTKYRIDQGGFLHNYLNLRTFDYVLLIRSHISMQFLDYSSHAHSRLNGSLLGLIRSTARATVH